MLVHHGDALRERIRRACGLDRRAAVAHDAGIRAMHAENQIAQRRFAGAVLAENAVDLARADVERDVRQRGETAEPLGNGLQATEAVRRPARRGRTSLLMAGRSALQHGDLAAT